MFKAFSSLLLVFALSCAVTGFACEDAIDSSQSGVGLPGKDLISVAKMAAEYGPTAAVLATEINAEVRQLLLILSPSTLNLAARVSTDLQTLLDSVEEGDSRTMVFGLAHILIQFDPNENADRKWDAIINMPGVDFIPGATGRIAKRMKERNLSQVKIAELVGVSQKQVHLWVSGKNPGIRGLYAARFCQALGFEFNDLFKSRD